MNVVIRGLHSDRSTKGRGIILSPYYFIMAASVEPKPLTGTRPSPSRRGNGAREAPAYLRRTSCANELYAYATAFTAGELRASTSPRIKVPRRRQSPVFHAQVELVRIEVRGARIKPLRAEDVGGGRLAPFGRVSQCSRCTARPSRGSHAVATSPTAYTSGVEVLRSRSTRVPESPARPGTRPALSRGEKDRNGRIAQPGMAEVDVARGRDDGGDWLRRKAIAPSERGERCGAVGVTCCRCPTLAVSGAKSAGAGQETSAIKRSKLIRNRSGSNQPLISPPPAASGVL